MEGLRNFAIWLLIFGLVGVYSQHHEKQETDKLDAEVIQSVGSGLIDVISGGISAKPNKRVRRLDHTFRRAQPASPSANDFQQNQGGQQGGLQGGRARTGAVVPADRNAARNAVAAANRATDGTARRRL